MTILFHILKTPRSKSRFLGKAHCTKDFGYNLPPRETSVELGKTHWLGLHCQLHKCKEKLFPCICAHNHLSFPLNLVISDLLESHVPYSLRATLYMSLVVHLQVGLIPWFTWLKDSINNQFLFLSTSICPIYKTPISLLGTHININGFLTCVPLA